ncbi:partial putative diguanylate cyclase DgcQ, partial [Rhodocyclaceae bacterium]
VSKQIRLLEEELGVDIFVRHGKRLTGITDPGRQILAIAERTLREVDFTARLGGEEFAVLLPGTDHAAALEAAERLRQAVAAAEVTVAPDTKVRFTASFGVATLFDPSATVDTLLNQADHALYEAKHLGRNRVCGVG